MSCKYCLCSKQAKLRHVEGVLVLRDLVEKETRRTLAAIPQLSALANKSRRHRFCCLAPWQTTPVVTGFVVWAWFPVSFSPNPGLTNLVSHVRFDMVRSFCAATSYKPWSRWVIEQPVPIHPSDSKRPLRGPGAHLAEMPLFNSVPG